MPIQFLKLCGNLKDIPYKRSESTTKLEKSSKTNFQKKIKMESLIVHPKNQMELSAIKSVLREMGIKFERSNFKNQKTEQKIFNKKVEKFNKDLKNKPKTGL